MHTSLCETKLGETRCGRVPRRGDRLEAFIDFWLNISQHFDTAGGKKITRLYLKIRISIKREIFIHECHVYEQYSAFSFKEHWQLRNAFFVLCKEPHAAGKRASRKRTCDFKHREQLLLLKLLHHFQTCLLCDLGKDLWPFKTSIFVTNVELLILQGSPTD